MANENTIKQTEKKILFHRDVIELNPENLREALYIDTCMSTFSLLGNDRTGKLIGPGLPCCPGPSNDTSIVI